MPSDMELTALRETARVYGELVNALIGCKMYAQAYEMSLKTRAVLQAGPQDDEEIARRLSAVNRALVALAPLVDTPPKQSATPRSATVASASLALVSVVAALVIIGLSRTSQVPTRVPPSPARADSAWVEQSGDTLEIDGVRLGMTADQVKSIKGDRASDLNDNGWMFMLAADGRHNLLEVYFDENGRVREMKGNALYRNGERLVSMNDPLSDITQHLGPPSIHEPVRAGWDWRYISATRQVTLTAFGTRDPGTVTEITVSLLNDSTPAPEHPHSVLTGRLTINHVRPGLNRVDVHAQLGSNPEPGTMTLNGVQVACEVYRDSSGARTPPVGPVPVGGEPAIPHMVEVVYDANDLVQAVQGYQLFREDGSPLDVDSMVPKGATTTVDDDAPYSRAGYHLNTHLTIGPGVLMYSSTVTPGEVTH